MKDDYWIVHGDIGIRCFPRVGSTTILRTYGYKQSAVDFMLMKKRFVVVRDPVERLWSAFQLYKTHRYTNVPKLEHLNDLMRYILAHPQEEVDNHCRSMTALLEGYKPRPGELVEMKQFLNNPPVDIALAHNGLWTRYSSQRVDMGGVDDVLYNEWLDLYHPDVELYGEATA